jgi:hypothetical protein
MQKAPAAKFYLADGAFRIAGLTVRTPAAGIVVVAVTVRPVIVAVGITIPEAIAIPSLLEAFAFQANPFDFSLPFDFAVAERGCEVAIVALAKIVTIPRRCDGWPGECQNRTKRQCCEFQFCVPHMPSKISCL